MVFLFSLLPRNASPCLAKNWITWIVWIKYFLFASTSLACWEFNCEAQLLLPFFSILILFNNRIVFVLWLSVFSWTENVFVALCQLLKPVNLKAHFSFSNVRYCLQMKQNAASREMSYSSHENFVYQFAWNFLFCLFFGKFITGWFGLSKNVLSSVLSFLK